MTTKTDDHHPKGLTAITTAALAAACWALAAAPSEATPDLRSSAVDSPVAASGWLDPEGRPLPLSEEEVLDFLRTAEVVSSRELSEGINRSLKVTLEKGGLRVHAVFRTVDDERRDGRRRFGGFRDHYVYEVAAYELSRELGLDNVPPAVLRTLDGRRGSLQLWIEQASSENHRIRGGARVSRPASWARQRHLMWVFDNLIYNFDRNPGNILIDASGKMWLIDHTRSFKRLPSLLSEDRIVVCDRRLWERLRTLDRADVRRRLSSFLDALELRSLLARHKKLVAHIARMIAERGEDKVLIGRG
ncbi:MAG: hypothetical protein V3T72_04260 [Thermoanaerobaculia bacterium]